MSLLEDNTGLAKLNDFYMMILTENKSNLGRLYTFLPL